jgi:HEAT repeats
MLSRLLLVFALVAQAPESFPPLGVIDFYGLRTVSEAQVRKALSIHEGDVINPNEIEKIQNQAEQRLTSVPGVKAAFLNFGCCTEDQKSTLYVGIQETNSACMVFHPAPQGNVRLTDDMVRAGSEFEAAFTKAIVSGDSAEDRSQGHSLNHNPEVRAIQIRFMRLAEEHFANLKDVLHNSADAGQRALAAQVLAYTREKQSVVPDLTAAMHDPSPEVRNSASRALMVFASYSPKPPASKIRISAKPFVEMLNSCIWTDRNKASLALAELTEQRDPALLAELRQQALPSLMEMALWKLNGHAEPALVILGRIVGLSDDQIVKDLQTGDREDILAAARKATS